MKRFWKNSRSGELHPSQTSGRRMWPGTNIADRTRFFKVRFNKQVQSLPYSTKFNTHNGAEYFRVIHDMSRCLNYAFYLATSEETIRNSTATTVGPRGIMPGNTI